MMLEFYIFFAHTAVIFTLPRFLEDPQAALRDPQAVGVFLLYLVPIFSAAFTYGLRGALLTWAGLFALCGISLWGGLDQVRQPEWPDLLLGLLPVFTVLLVLAMMVGLQSALKSRAEQEITDRLARITTLNRMQELLRDAIYYENLWQHVLTLASFIIPSGGGAVLAADGSRRSVFGDALPPVAALLLPDGRQLTALTADAVHVLAPPRGQRRAWRGVRSLLAAPLREQGQVTALLVLVNPQSRRQYGPAERDLLAVVVNQVQVALENARLFRTAALDAQRLQFILRSISSGVLSCDLQGRITEANEAALTLLNYRREELVGRVLQQDVFLFRGEPLLLEALRQGYAANSTETVLATKDHRDLDAGMSTWQLRDDADTVIGAIAVFKDLGELKRMQRELATREKLAAVGSLAAGMAHELRNPLGGVEGFASLLRRELQDRPAVRALADKIMAGVGEVNRVLEQFLALTEERRLQYAAVALADFCRQLTASLDGEARARGVGWDLAGIDPGLTLKADPLVLRQVLQVLLRNALEASATGGTVAVRAQFAPGQGRAVLSVLDHGVGIPPELRDRIFQPFFTTKETGTGLGLAVAQRHVAALGGDLTVDSEPGRGSVFTVSLPVA